MTTASSKSSWNPSVTQAVGVRAIGVEIGISSSTSNVKSTRSIAHAEQATLNRDRQIQRTPGGEFLAVNVAAGSAGWKSRMDARFSRRHPVDAHERAQGYCMPVLVAGCLRLVVKRPDVEHTRR